MGIQAFKSVARQRARLVGRLIKLEQRIMTDSATIPELRAKIHSYNDVLSCQGIDVDPDIYAPPVTPTPTCLLAHCEACRNSQDILDTSVSQGF